MISDEVKLCNGRDSLSAANSGKKRSATKRVKDKIKIPKIKLAPEDLDIQRRQRHIGFMQNDITQQAQPYPDTYQQVLVKFIDEINETSNEELEVTLKELKHVCMEFDPYQPHKISDEVQLTLKKYGLDDMLSNPFTFTNNLLRILTSVESEYKQRS